MLFYGMLCCVKLSSFPFSATLFCFILYQSTLFYVTLLYSMPRRTLLSIPPSILSSLLFPPFLPFLFWTNFQSISTFSFLNFFLGINVICLRPIFHHSLNISPLLFTSTIVSDFVNFFHLRTSSSLLHQISALEGITVKS